MLRNFIDVKVNLYDINALITQRFYFVSILVLNYIDASMRTIIYDIKGFTHKGCFGSYAIIFYGTSSFSKAEAIMIHIVSKSQDIHEFVVNINIFENKLCSKELARHVVNTPTKNLNQKPIIGYSHNNVEFVRKRVVQKIPVKSVLTSISMQIVALHFPRGTQFLN